MAKDRVLIVGGAAWASQMADIVRSATADIYAGPPPIELTIRKPEPTFPDIRVLREPKKRDWEQRRKTRRRS